MNAILCTDGYKVLLCGTIRTTCTRKAKLKMELLTPYGNQSAGYIRKAKL